MVTVSESGNTRLYLVQVTDKRGANEPIAESETEAADAAVMGDTALAGSDPTEPASRAGGGGTTSSGLNVRNVVSASVRVALPALNALTNGVASKVQTVASMGFGLLNAVATGSAGGIVGAVASIAAYGVGQIVGNIVNQRNENDAIARSIEQTNLLRASVGLSTLDIERRGLTQRVVITNDR